MFYLCYTKKIEKMTDYIVSKEMFRSLSASSNCEDDVTPLRGNFCYPTTSKDCAEIPEYHSIAKNY